MGRSRRGHDMVDCKLIDLALDLLKKRKLIAKDQDSSDVIFTADGRQFTREKHGDEWSAITWGDKSRNYLVWMPYSQFDGILLWRFVHCLEVDEDMFKQFCEYFEIPMSSLEPSPEKTWAEAEDGMIW